nr:putative methyltransferase DDB_G0268948 [Lytechinus pictus]
MYFLTFSHLHSDFYDSTMSNRFFEGASHADQYIKFRPTYSEEVCQKILRFLNEKRPPPHQLLVDVGCGSGQGTYGLSSQFERVIGFDVSPAQVEAATKENTFPNVEFKVSPAETLPLDDQSVDLITCFEAVHWFDFDEFCNECRRVLKQNGCLAIINYGDYKIEHEDEHITKNLERYFKELERDLEKFWLSKGKFAQDGLPGLQLPFPQSLREESLQLRCKWSVSQITGYIRSCSAFQRQLKTNPSDQVIKDYQSKVMSAVASPSSSPDDVILNIVWPLTLLLGRI